MPEIAAALASADSKTVKEDKKTEGGICVGCGPTTAPKTGLQKIDPSHIAGATPKAVETRASNSNGNECLRKLILASAKNVVKNIYGNAPTSGGWCAKGVGRSLMKAGYQYPSAEAIGYHTGGRMKQMGFENIMRKGLDAENAPPGAILVFRGPLTKMSRANGGLPQGKTRMQSRRLRGGRGAGTWVGHVTIKSDKPDEYLTDALTEDPAVANRTLVAIYVPVTCSGVTCKGAAARACVE